MSDQQDFEALLPKLNAIDKKLVRRPDMPVNQAVKEGELMAAAAAEDAAKLTAVGLDSNCIKELDLSVGALRYAEAQLTAALGEVKEAGLQWKQEEPGAYELRADILAALTYGLKSVPDAVKSLKKIREGSGNADMVQDLAGLSQLGKKYQNKLQAINFDVKLLDTAAEKAELLGNLLVKSSLEKATAGAKDVRDRSFTYMRQYMGTVLDAAEYALRKDSTRLDFYHSTYRSRRSGSSQPEPVTTVTVPAAPSAAGK